MTAQSYGWCKLRYAINITPTKLLHLDYVRYKIVESIDAPVGNCVVYLKRIYIEGYPFIGAHTMFFPEMDCIVCEGVDPIYDIPMPCRGARFPGGSLIDINEGELEAQVFKATVVYGGVQYSFFRRNGFPIWVVVGLGLIGVDRV